MIILSSSLSRFKNPAFPGNQTQEFGMNSFIKLENESFALFYFF